MISHFDLSAKYIKLYSTYSSSTLYRTLVAHPSNIYEISFL